MSQPSTKVIARRLRRYLGGMLAIASFEGEPVVEARVAPPMTRSKPVVAPAKPILDFPVIDVLSAASRRPFEVVSAPVVEPPKPTRSFAKPPVRVDVVPAVPPRIRTRSS